MDSPLDAIGGPDCEARSETAARGSPVADDQELERGKKRPRDDASADDAESGDARSDDWSAWGNLWQVPAIVLSAALIFLGISIATHRQPDNDFRGALDQVEQLLTGGQLDLAASQLNDVIEPKLYLASQPEQARFHALVGDWIAASQADQEIDVLENHRRVAEQYARAEDLGARMGPARLERFALALIAVGDREEALNACRLLVEADPDNAAARVALAAALIDEGELDEAFVYLDEALARRPDYGPARTTLGRWYEARGEVEEARRQWLRAGQLRQPEALALLGDSFAPDTVPPEIVRALRSQLADGEPYHSLGSLYYRRSFYRASPNVRLLPGEWQQATPSALLRARDALARWTDEGIAP